MDLDLLAERVRQTYWHETVESGDGTVTFSWVNMATPGVHGESVQSRAGVWMTLHPDGTLSSDSHVVDPGAEWDGGRSQPLPLRFLLPRLVRDAYVPDDGEHDRDGIASNAARAVSAWLPRDARGHTAMDGEADRMRFVMAAGVGGLLAAARRFLGRLDPEALRLFRRHWHHRVWLSESWRDLLPVSGRGAPLAEALGRHPGFPNAVMRIHEVLGGDAMAARLGERGWLDGLVVRDLLSQRERRTVGVRPALVPLVAKVERGLGAYMDRVALACHRDPQFGVSLAGVAMPMRYEEDWATSVARTLRKFPAAWTPESVAQWDAFGDLLMVVRSAGGEAGRDGDLASVVPCGGDWVGMRRRLTSVAGVAPDRLSDALWNVRDMVDAYAREVLLAADPETFRDDPDDDGRDLDRLRRQARQVLAGGRTLARVLELSADWHRRHGRMRADVAVLPGAYRGRDGWPPGLPDATYGDVEVKVLTDVAALVDEGSTGRDADGVEGLGNCLAGYGESCRSGRSRIVSLRRRLPEGGFERMSAAEVHVDDPDLGAGQHVGWADGPAPAGMVAVLDAYLSDCRSGVLRVDLVGFAPVRAAPGQAVARACGFDPSVEATRLAVRAMWDRYVPKPLRAMDRDMLRALPSPPVRPDWPASAPVPRPPEPDHFEEDADEADECLAFPMGAYR